MKRPRNLKWKLHYYFRRMVRQHGSPHKIALGAAVGVFLGFFPTFGVGTFLALLLATIFRLNKIAALVGTVIGIPWFAPFIWTVSYLLGAFILREDWRSFLANFQVREIPQRALLPYWLGNFIISLTSGVITYVVILQIIQITRRRKRKARLQKIKLSEAGVEKK